MLEFELPWIFYLLPLPLAAYWLLPRARQQQSAVRVPFYSELGELTERTKKGTGNKLLRWITLLLIWMALLTAAAGPTWIGDEISLPSSGRDLLIAVDLSGSMQIEDMKINGKITDRLVAVKSVVSDFISRRKGDRIGLILFGDKAYVQAPLTFDLPTVQRFLEESQIGFAGQQTAIGDAIGLSVKRLRERPGKRHIMVLLTDGSNTAGKVQPLTAARLAAENNIIIYTIGVGADEMLTPGVFGSSFGSRRVNPSADLDEKSLQAIAKKTGGKYFRARNPAELANIYQLLDELEPVEDNEQTFRPTQSLFYWPLAAAFLTSLLAAFLMMPWKNWFNSLWSSKQSPEQLS